LITLFERQSLPYHTLKLADDDPLLDTLDHVNQSAGRELIRLERKGLLATQFVGVIQAGQHLIQILPKIDNDPNGNADAPVGSAAHNLAALSAARNFLYILAHTRGIKLHHQTVANLRTSRGAWLEMLTSLFVNELMAQMQQGFHQDYVRREEMLPYVRGRWNIARQYSLHPILSQGLDLSYDDYSPDTILNRVFRLAVDRLQRQTKDLQIRRQLTKLESWLLEAQPLIQIGVEELDSIQFTRLNERFLPPFNLARLFLEGQTVQLLHGGQRASAFVFDMDSLFQQFVASLMQNQSKRILPEAWKDSQIELQGSRSNKHLVQPASPAEGPMFRLKPDILLRLSGLPRLIIDTKNKALPIQQPHRAVDAGDVFQMMAYALRFQCSDVLLLYPRTFGGGKKPTSCLLIDNSPIRIYVASLDLHQPLDQLDRIVWDIRMILDSIQPRNVDFTEVLWHT
jgi:5-methylcytosine-specific restriction enzyme subunit McrC